MAVIRFKIYILAFYASLLIPSSCHGHSWYHKKKSQPCLSLVIHCSMLGTINTTTDYQANFWPYGKSFFKNPTGKFLDGLLIPDIIGKILYFHFIQHQRLLHNSQENSISAAAAYAKLPLIPPHLQTGFDNYTQGVNFASAGAGALAETHQGFVCNLPYLLISLRLG